jgi:hypothetical protein
MTEHLYNLPSEETPPKAGAMINTFRAFGYNLPTAIADLIDNCITAKANNVWIHYEWAGEKSWVTITDDGHGMNRDELKQAMTPGSKDPQDERDKHDLGRFGLGLKTASFSQCKALTVISKREDYNIVKRHWDLDFVNETGKWNLLDYLSDEKFLSRLKEMKHGTTVLWEKLDRLVGNSNVHNEAVRAVYQEEFEKVAEHLSLVFHRYIDRKKINLWMNGNKLEPWDPFMKDSSATQCIGEEILDNNQVTVKCYVIPHISKLSPEERKIAKTEEWYNLQGFYIYRNGRLLLYGDWLGLFPKAEHYKNARILVDIPNKLDHEWKIDIKKATAMPPVSVRNDLVRLGKKTIKEAAELPIFRGTQIKLGDSSRSFNFQPFWQARKSRDEIRHYYINLEHPVIKGLLEQPSIRATDFKTVLKLIGETIPIEAIIRYHSEEPESHELRDQFKELESKTIQLAQMMYKSLLKSGTSHDMAVKQIFRIEPFNQYPQLIEYFK